MTPEFRGPGSGEPPEPALALPHISGVISFNLEQFSCNCVPTVLSYVQCIGYGRTQAI